MKVIKFPYTGRNIPGNPHAKGWPKGRPHPEVAKLLRERGARRRKKIIDIIRGLKSDEMLEVRSVGRRQDIGKFIKRYFKKEDFTSFYKTVQGKTFWFIRKKQEGEE